jgi:tetratricopeptide (TPR) repeat protein
MTALHHFEYEDANDAFRETQRIDPGFALAYWGEAMTYHQTLWRRENIEAARHALGRLAATPARRAAKANTPRARALLGAVELLFGDGDAPSRQDRYAAAMAQVHAAFPDDPDIASLYALALMSTVSRGLLGYSDAQDSLTRGLAGSTVQQQVATLLDQVQAAHPRHPGALHYLLHDYDDPEHARLALNAARRYTMIAGGSSHALHMPAHIFLQLGLWGEAASSDRAAFDASADRARRKGLGPVFRNYHALAWLEYELLQLGRYSEAWQTVVEIKSVVNADSAGGDSSAGGVEHSGHQPLLSDLSSMRARYVIEARRWDLMAAEQNFGNVDELFAIGLSAARTNHLQLAETARQALAARVQSEQEGDLRPAIAIMEREVAGLIALAGGRRDEATRTLQVAARSELDLPAPFGMPAPAKPAPELLGEVLLEIGRPREAAEWFEQALRRNANRTLSVLGRARAAAALGDADAARERYGDVLASFYHADAGLPELSEARTALERLPASRALPASGARSRTLLWAVLGGLMTAALLTGIGIGARRRANRTVDRKARRKVVTKARKRGT